MTDVYVGIGSNIDRHASIARAIHALQLAFGRLELSPVYECPAVGFSGAPFFNLVVKFTSSMPPLELVGRLDEIEREGGRTRMGHHMTSRQIDLDLLLYGTLVDHSQAVRVPRRDILEYPFVLRPLAELAPDLRHPETGKTMNELWQSFDKAGLPMTAVTLAASEYCQE